MRSTRSRGWHMLPTASELAHCATIVCFGFFQAIQISTSIPKVEDRRGIGGIERDSILEHGDRLRRLAPCIQRGVGPLGGHMAATVSASAGRRSASRARIRLVCVPAWPGLNLAASQGLQLLRATARYPTAAARADRAPADDWVQRRGRSDRTPPPRHGLRPDDARLRHAALRGCSA
jgi:hypothetical protein